MVPSALVPLDCASLVQDFTARRVASGRKMSRTHRALSDLVEIWSEQVDEQGPDGAPGVLDAAERERAGRYRFARDRERFVARRAFLRRVLAGYLGIAPAAIRYRHAARSRPEIDPSYGISFSTSHSDGLAIVAVARGRLVGVDLERLRPIPDALDLARSLFAPPEYEHVRNVPVDARCEVFLHLWTRKEAYVKALGVGMSLPFDRFDVLDHDADGQIIEDSARGARFAVARLEGVPGYIGSVVLSDALVGAQGAARPTALLAVAS